MVLLRKKGLKLICDGIETDLHLTKDGVVVLCHDETVDRTATGSGWINEYYYRELLKLDFGIKFGNRFKGEKIPTLDELLILANTRNHQLSGLFK